MIEPRSVLASTRPGSLGLAGAVAIIVFGLSLFLPGLGNWVLTRHEVLAAQPAKEMLSGGHWIIPHFAGEPRTIKPPGTGWVIALLLTIFQSDAEAVVRLPAVLAAVVCALATASIAAHWFGRFVALTAGVFQLTIYLVLKQARLAEADMLQSAATTVAMAAFVLGVVHRAETPAGSESRSKWLAVLFWAATGVSVVLKGIGPIFVLPACLVFLVARALVARRTSPARAAHASSLNVENHNPPTGFRFLWSPIGIALFVVIAGTWPMLALREDPSILSTWWMETFDRAAGAFNDDEPWHFYFWSIPLAVLPWFFHAILGTIAGTRQLNPSPAAPRQASGKALEISNVPLSENASALAYRPPAPAHSNTLLHRLAHPVPLFLLCWFFVGFLILSISSAKHIHYPLPITPPVVVVAAYGLLVYLRWAHARPIGRPTISLMLWSAALLGGAWAVWRFAPRGGAGMSVTLILVMLGGVVALWLEHRRKPAQQFAALAATVWAGAVATQLLVMPQFDGYRASAQLGTLATTKIPQGENVLLFGFPNEPHIAYYIDRPLRRISTLKAFDVLVADESVRSIYIVTTERHLVGLNERGNIRRIESAALLRRGESAEDRMAVVEWVRKPK